MSKSPNILLPALGVTGIVLGGALAWLNSGYGEAEIAMLQNRVDTAESNASSASKKAATEAARVADLEAQITEVQAAATTRQAASVSLSAPAPESDGALNIGRPALDVEVAAWDVDVLPDGRGLPEGTGNAYDGEELFADKCASCHGDFAEGVDNWPVLAGGFDTLADDDPVKTVGSYWPHLSTVWDYVSRSMPFGEAGTLTPDETYAIVAYILYSNDLIDDEFELTHENLGSFEMPNKDGFILDDRPETEYSKWRTEPCMKNCKEEVEVTMRSVFLVETPPEGGTSSEMNNATVEGLPTFSATGPSFIPAVAEKPEAGPKVEPASEDIEAAGEEGQLVAAGEKVFKKCASCHQVGAGAKNRSGPVLTGIVGRPAGTVEGFKYSNPMIEASEGGLVWTEAELAAFLAAPRDYMKGTKMSFSGLRKDSDQVAVIEYLKSVEE